MRPKMPLQDAQVRKTNFNEVALGYSEESAKSEAARCLQCKKPLCVAGCPVGVNIPGFIDHIAKGDYTKALEVLRETNSLPAVCGRVCPQETQCEIRCILGKKEEPIAIGRLERFAADHGAIVPEDTQTKDILAKDTQVAPPTGMKVAVVGSGPAGLTAAAQLAKDGHSVTLFEAFHEAGGVLVYGIPEFRLPKQIVKEEVEYIRSLGVDIQLNAVIGRAETVDELLGPEGYDAVFLATGAGLPTFLGIEGENLIGVYSANEFLTRVNLMKAYKFPDYDTPVKRGGKVIVVGGGNVAMDAARCALRLGSDVTIVYRRSEEELPARREEVENAMEEGIVFNLLTNPVRIIAKDGWVAGMECVRMELGEPDESGRRRPVTIKGSEFTIDADTVIVAIGTSPNPLIPATTPDLEVSKWGAIITSEDGATSKKYVYAGGDVVTGAATVISAMGAGRDAAAAISKLIGRKA